VGAVLAVILLVGLVDVFISQEMLASVFNGNMFFDALMGTLAGGISVGQPVVSYIIGGELLEGGVSLYAIVALIVSWVTLGIVQLPLEQALFGRRFTIQRNILVSCLRCLLPSYVLRSSKLFHEKAKRAIFQSERQLFFARSASGLSVLLSVRAMKLPWLPLMVDYFGWLFTVVLTIVLIVAGIVQGMMMERFVKPQEQ